MIFRERDRIKNWKFWVIDFIPLAHKRDAFPRSVPPVRNATGSSASKAIINKFCKEYRSNLSY